MGEGERCNEVNPMWSTNPIFDKSVGNSEDAWDGAYGL